MQTGRQTAFSITPRLAVVGVLLIGLLAACDLLPESIAGHRSPAFRYRLSAIVKTPQGERSGSSVIEIQRSSGGSAWGPMQGGSITQKGDAVVVDLPNGKKLFVLLTARDNYDWPGLSLKSVFGPSSRDPSDEPRTVRLLPRKEKDYSGEMLDNWPYFVTFTDPAVASTIREVDPDNLAATFGKGYSVKALTVQLTDAPITRGIERTLPWLPSVRGALLKDGNTPIGDLPIAGRVTDGSFSREQ